MPSSPGNCPNRRHTFLVDWCPVCKTGDKAVGFVESPLVGGQDDGLTASPDLCPLFCRSVPNTEPQTSSNVLSSKQKPPFQHRPQGVNGDAPFSCGQQEDQCLDM